jgi:inositol phosphorylceramide synthase catalytic subunit
VDSIVNKIQAHIRKLWPGWGILLPLPFVLWGVGCFLAGERRWEHWAFMIGVPLLAYTNEKTKKLFVGLFPVGLLGLIYDAMRFVKNVGLSEETVHVCDLRAIDMKIASVSVNGTQGSVHDWLQQHSRMWLDILCAIPYGTFIYIILVFAIYLYIKDYKQMQLFGWTFVLLNVAGFITYHVYPAAPPWYYHAHGCVVDLSAHASEGPNLARVDSWLGFQYFGGLYGRSNDVFGAMPSLHVAYPMLILLYGWRMFKTPGRVFSVLFLVAMCFSAVYLDHHWIIDVLVGLSYTVLVQQSLRFIAEERQNQAGSTFSMARWWTAIKQRVAWVLALWFGCGRVPIAPGTAGTFGAIPLYLILRPFGYGWVLVVALVVTLVGVWAANWVVRSTGNKDPQIVVIDEVAGVLVTLAASSPTWLSLGIGVLLFRIYDQFKPWPARMFEKRLPEGWGVVMDDVAAGVWGAVTLLALRGAGIA